MDVDGPHDVAPHLAHEHHSGHIEGLLVGDPQAVDELALLAEPAQQCADLRPSAVHDHGPQPDRAEQHDVLGERRGQLRVDHGVAAVLDDDHRAAEALDVGQRLDERRRPSLGREAPVGEHVVVGHERYPALMSM